MSTPLPLSGGIGFDRMDETLALDVLAAELLSSNLAGRKPRETLKARGISLCEHVKRIWSRARSFALGAIPVPSAGFRRSQD